MSKQGRTTEEAQVSLLESYQRFFGDGDGQDVIYDLMGVGFFLKPTYDPDPMVAARNEGRRELILYILEQCNRDVKELVKFIEEQEKSRGNFDEDY